MHRVHQDEATHEQFLLDLDEIARQGAQRMLAHALQAEVDAYLKAAQGERDEHGHALWSLGKATTTLAKSSAELAA